MMERWVEEQGLYAVAVRKILQDMKESLIQSSNIYHFKGVELTRNSLRKDLKGGSDKLMQVSICVPFQKVWYDIHLGKISMLGFLYEFIWIARMLGVCFERQTHWVVLKNKYL